jgi:hypothetical protein|nr:MAG TPA: portal protein [Caudoviricetes sp.]
MELSISSRLKHAWNAFQMNRNPTYTNNYYGSSSSTRPDRMRFSRGNEKSIVTSIYNRIALDVSQLSFEHVQLDKDGRYSETKTTGLNTCLTLEANLDQTSRAFFQDAALSMFDEGSIALVPIDTNLDPNITGGYDIESIRVGQILTWYPKHIKVRLYNEQTGIKEDRIIPKSIAAIIENPFYTVMNQSNSTMQRLIRKLSLLDAIDEQSASGKLDLIIQLPYTVKSNLRKQQAEERRKAVEDQLYDSKYGIAYIDSTERVIQLNRPVENNLMSQIEYLQNLLYSQLGITQSILDGSADDKTMLNYYNRIVEPIAAAFVDEMRRKFLTKTARTQGQSIMFFRDPFKLVPVNELAEISDKLTRNEIASSNEMRQTIGWKPSKDPKADELRNKNLNQPESELQKDQTSQDLKGIEDKDKEEIQNG